MSPCMWVSVCVGVCLCSRIEWNIYETANALMCSARVLVLCFSSKKNNLKFSYVLLSLVWRCCCCCCWFCRTVFGLNVARISIRAEGWGGGKVKTEDTLCVCVSYICSHNTLHALFSFTWRRFSLHIILQHDESHSYVTKCTQRSARTNFVKRYIILIM